MRLIPLSAKLSVLFFLFLSSFAPIHASAAQAQKTLYPVADALVYSGEENTNYGSYDVLEIGYSNNTGTLRHSFIKFDFSTIPADATLSSAQLVLHLTACEGGMSPNQVIAGPVSANWIESQVTWKMQPGYSAGSTRAASCDGSSFWEFDVTQTVQGWFDGQANYGFALYSNSSAPFLRRFSSREQGGLTNQPQLLVTYTVPDAPAGNEGQPNDPPADPGTGSDPGDNTAPDDPVNDPGTDNDGNPDNIPPVVDEFPVFLPDDSWDSMPIFSPLVSSFGSSFSCIFLICCCLLLLLLVVLIVVLSKRKAKQEPTVIVVQSADANEKKDEDNR